MLKEKTVYNHNKIKGGVRWRGLRGDQPGPDPKPDLDHANVGKS